MWQLKQLCTDILVIGAGTAGCYSALTIAENSAAQVVLVDKANITRSGCLAAGVNALNAYIAPGESPESYLDYVRRDSEQIIRDDLVYSIAQRLNKVTQKIASLGLPLLKDTHGNYILRGKRSIKINGQSIKPLLAKAVENLHNVKLLNHVNVVDYILVDKRVIGAYGFSVRDGLIYVISAKAVICATGGAAGLYRPNNPGFSRHKMWYSPFNTGAGYAMGIRAGAEMTGFEMRFIALRCKDTIAPTGTIAQGVKTPQINVLGAEYLSQHEQVTTPDRLFATMSENYNGRGPCYLKTLGINAEQEADLYQAFLNMAPSQTLKWIDQGKGPSSENVEIDGTEPYIVGGHTGSGYWVDTKRFTTIEGLLAAGDVAGGSPKKYVTGCFAEGEIAALSALEYIADKNIITPAAKDIKQIQDRINSFLAPREGLYGCEEVEEGMQKVMDEYAGGIASGYTFNMEKLAIAKQRIAELAAIATGLRAKDGYGLLQIQEILDRLEVCKSLIAHLMARQETRWPCYQSNTSFPNKDDANWLKYVNSRKLDGKISIILRDLVRDYTYEH